MEKYYRAESKKEWYTTDDISLEQLKIGAILRIADATELMAKRYNDLISDRDWYKKRYDELTAENKRLSRSLAATKGYYKKKK